ncbi:MAG: energy transducer TonB [Gammaproteobacteria bacterium]|jgi:protein TonB
MSEANNQKISIPSPTVITPVDRFSLTLCLAIISHAVVVLGITFANEDISPPNYEAMEIILVQQKSDAPEDAKLLAQANLEGGGDTSDEVTPATPLPSPFPDNIAELVTPPQSESQIQSESNSTQDLITTNDDTSKLITSISNNITNDSTDTKQNIEKTTTTKTLPTATTLLTNSLKIAALSAAIERKLETRSERPRRKYISASTKEFIYAAYMEAWRAKVERIGNLNYPDAARQLNLSGNLILDVAVNMDGSISEVIIRRSSGHKVLDDAAIRIVKLAAPYASFPKNIQSETDILHITRTWQFLNNGGFQ